MKYEDIVAKVKVSYEKANAEKVDGHLAVQVNVTGEGEGAFYVEVADAKISVEPYEYFDRDFIIVTDADSIIGIADGKKVLSREVEAGKASVIGNADKVSEFEKIEFKKAETVKKAVKEAAAELKAEAKEAATEVKTAAAAKKTNVKKAVKEAKEAAKAEVAEKKAAVKKEAKAVKEEVKADVAEKKASVKKAAKEVKEQAKAEIADVKEEIKEVKEEVKKDVADTKAKKAASKKTTRK